MAEKSTKKATTEKKEVVQTPEQQLVAKRADLIAAQKSHASGELVNPRVLNGIRKDIARLLTTINAQKEAK